jgi:hypothetical protein
MHLAAAAAAAAPNTRVAAAAAAAAPITRASVDAPAWKSLCASAAGSAAASLLQQDHLQGSNRINFCTTSWLPVSADHDDPAFYYAPLCSESRTARHCTDRCYMIRLLDAPEPMYVVP